MYGLATKMLILKTAKPGKLIQGGWFYETFDVYSSMLRIRRQPGLTHNFMREATEQTFTYNTTFAFLYYHTLHLH